MTTARIKFLHRRKILQSDMEIRLEVLGPTKRFSAKFNLDQYKFPPSSRIYIDAKQLLERIRFDFGPVSSPRTGTSVDISRLKGERITFDVLVVDASIARKLGSAETVRPLKAGDSSNDPKELLPIDASQRLDGVVWRIDYSDNWEGSSDAPVLLFDKVAAHDSASDFSRNAWVRSLVFPSAMREILTKILLLDHHHYEPASTAWRDAWVRFAAKAAGQEPPEVNEGDEGPAGDVDDWIGLVVGKVATHSQFLENLLRETSR
jgi:hypothetical protein